ncbi:MAG TPA: D-cysteine desulfhydrase family protein [Armatimonadota bacterium]|jgi:D-cysteine desulfhydrase family pyridoxal phosphate-dependent enzyme
MILDRFPRFHLADLPTALEDAPRLAEAIGIPRLLIKRDDNTGLAMGGNKARKLEFLIADARTKGADVVLTCGGPQSNHVRMTAAAARKAGMDTILFMPRADMPDRFEGNLLLDAVLGAEIRFLPDLPFEELDRAMAEEEKRLIAQNRMPYSIPMGGSTPLGDLGYVLAVHEAAEQMKALGIESADMVAAVGTGGTLAGIVLGAALFSPESKPVGVSVLWQEHEISAQVMEMARHAASLAGVECPNLSPVPVYDGYVGKGYGIPTPECREAILLTARTEGIILDPVYTGKAMAGLIDLARKGVIGQDRPVLFWHTGGAPGLFVHETLFHGEAVRLSITE